MTTSSETGGHGVSAAPLTKLRKRDGTPYTRPPEIEREIEAALERPLFKLLDPASPCSSQCLLYFVRHLRPNGPSPTYDALVLELLSRVDRQVRSRLGGVPIHGRPVIRERVRDQFLERLASGTDALDIFEARFALAVKALSIDAIRDFMLWDSVETPIEELAGESPEGDAAGALDAIIFKGQRQTLTEAEARLELESVRSMLNEQEKKAVLAVHQMGLKIESTNPHEITAATLMNMTGRGVRYHLQSAARKANAQQERVR